MIRHITIRELGPHEATAVTLDPDGWTEVAGPSESGKTTLLDGVCLALWGQDRTGSPFDPARIRDGAKSVHVAVALKSGARIVRELEIRGGSRHHRRMYVGRSGEETPSTEQKWLARLGPLGREIDLLRLVLVPGAWEALELGEGGGRPLRDAMLRATRRGAVDLREIVGELLGEWLLGKDDPIDEAGAKDRRKAARRALDRAEGALQQAEAGLALRKADVPKVPSEAAQAQARALVSLGEAWARYAADAGAYEAAAAEVEGLEERRAEWRAAVEELGPRPEAPTEAESLQAAAAVSQARSALDAARREHHAAAIAQGRLFAPRAEAPEAAHLLKLRGEELAALEAAEVNDTCPHCQRPGWDGAHAAHRERLDDAVARVAAARLELTEAEERDAVASRRYDEERAQARARVVAADEAVAAAEIAVHAAEAAQTKTIAARGEAARWETARARLGSEPSAPQLPAPPVEPAEERPGPGALRSAQALLDEARRAEGAREQIAKDVARLEAAVAQGREAVDNWRAEVDRLEALVEAVRLAPTEALMRQLAVLGDLGPVSLEPRGAGGLRVLVDGRPWQVASDGRRVVADLWLRAGIRRALGLRWLPLFVDRAQDVGGQDLPPVPGPVIVLRTTDGPWEVRELGRVALEAA